MDNWDRTQTKLLLTLLKQCPALYNSRDPNFTNKFMRNEKLKFILNELEVYKPDLTVQSIKKKIRTLQSQLCKEKFRAIKHKKNSSEEYKPKLWCFDDVSFLINTNAQKVNYYSEDEEVVVANEAGEELSNYEESYEKPRISNSIKVIDEAKEQKDTNIYDKKLMISEEISREAIDTLRFAKNFAMQQQMLETSGREESFCNYLCSELKKITSDDIFDDLKLDILQLVRKTIKEEKMQMLLQQQ